MKHGKSGVQLGTESDFTPWGVSVEVEVSSKSGCVSTGVSSVNNLIEEGLKYQDTSLTKT